MNRKHMGSHTRYAMKVERIAATSEVGIDGAKLQGALSRLLQTQGFAMAETIAVNAHGERFSGYTGSRSWLYEIEYASQWDENHEPAQRRPLGPDVIMAALNEIERGIKEAIQVKARLAMVVPETELPY